MGAYSSSAAIKSSTPAAMVFEAYISTRGLISGALPPVFESTNVVEHFTRSEGNRVNTVKETVEARDNKKFTYCYSITEVDALGTTLEKICLKVQITESPKGGSVCKITSEHFAKNDADITEEKKKAVKEKTNTAFQVIKAYLVANPRA